MTFSSVCSVHTMLTHNTDFQMSCIVQWVGVLVVLGCFGASGESRHSPVVYRFMVLRVTSAASGTITAHNKPVETYAGV